MNNNIIKIEEEYEKIMEAGYNNDERDRQLANLMIKIEVEYNISPSKKNLERYLDNNPHFEPIINLYKKISNSRCL